MGLALALASRAWRRHDDLSAWTTCVVETMERLVRLVVRFESLRVERSEYGEQHVLRATYTYYLLGLESLTSRRTAHVSSLLANLQRRSIRATGQLLAST